MSFFQSLSLIPSFTTPTGPYLVGTREIESPASEFSSPPPDQSISTVSYRIFYPCSPVAKGKAKHVYWLPEPQHEYFAAYARFLRASPWLASLLSYFPLLRPLFHITVPAIPSAPLLAPSSTSSSSISPPASSDRWPVSIFSHGLGGSKNAYSALCTSLASHGLVVVAVDHRDGSAPVSFIRTQQGSTFKNARKIDFWRLGHAGGAEVDAKRDQQLRIRCWEMGAAFESMSMLDRGQAVTNLADDLVKPRSWFFTSATTAAAAAPPPSPSFVLEDFRDAIDVNSPGRVAWIGHSYGAATVAQFVKSVAYYDDCADGTTLLTHPPLPALRSQITSASPTVFLDLWAQPLRSVHTRQLWDRPLPCYTIVDDDDDEIWRGNGHVRADTSPNLVPAVAPLAILSESFFNWKANLADIIRLISPPPLPPPSSSSPSSPPPVIKPHIFYPLHSAHLSQSDFGPLFPWLTRRVFKAEDPQRTIQLNVRAILEVLRRAGLGGRLARPITTTTTESGEVGVEVDEKKSSSVAAGAGAGEGDVNDDAILDTAEGRVRGWVAVEILPGPDAEPVVVQGEKRREVGRSGRGDAPTTTSPVVGAEVKTKEEVDHVVRDLNERADVIGGDGGGEDEGYDSPGR